MKVVAHKTPQIKPSAPELAMHGTSVPDNYSNDDKKNEVFALPLVGKRRKAHEANLSKLTNLPSKRSNV